MSNDNIEGLDNVLKELSQLRKKAKGLEGKDSVPLGELLHPRFMQRHTQFSALAEMFEASPWSVETVEDFAAIPQSELDSFVAETTNFNTWRDMTITAAQKWALSKLGF